MINKYLLIAASSVLVLASCSDDLQHGEGITPPDSKTLSLKRLDLASQSNRVSYPLETKGQKANRLQLVAKIAPIAGSDAANYNWSATGISIYGGNAYVSWHSNHQASTPAERWGGALDEISISELLNPSEDGSAIKSTLTSSRVKFNNVVAAGGNLYFPLTCYNNGAVIGRLAIGAETMDTIGIPGSSANAVAVEGSTLYAVTGYAGGAYSMPAAFNDDTKFDAEVESNRINTIVAASASFGGKYIDGGYILRTDDTNAALVSVADGTERSLGAPLTSDEKYAETYDPANGEWLPLTGTQAAHYGKHTMAVDDDYIYVAGGKGENGANALRVYSATGSEPVWQNGNNTTAVCLQGNYVYAATGTGLRVYEKFDGSELKLYAFEVLDYDGNGNALDHEGMNQPMAGTDAHSSNFVAVDSQSGLIFVACGQSGVYVFKLNHEAAPTTVNVTLTIPDINYDKDKEVEPGDNAVFTIPGETPEVPEGKEFVGWSEDPENPDSPIYKPGDKVTIPAGEEDSETELKPVYKDKEVSNTFTVSFNIENAAGTTPKSVVITTKETSYDFSAFPAQGDLSRGEAFTFKGWATVPAELQGSRTKVYTTGDTFHGTADQTFYPVWSIKQTGGGTVDPEEIDG